MEGIRFEQYNEFKDHLPFSLGINIHRTPYNLSKEQNWHENLELQLCTQGMGTVLIDGTAYPFQEGDILFINSNELHYTATDDFLTYTCLIISPDWCRRMNINYDFLSFTPHIKSETLQNLIFELQEVYGNYHHPLRIAKANEVLLRIMIELTEKHSCEKKTYTQKGNHFEIVKNAISYLHQNYKAKLTLDEIAKAIFYDKYALCKEFKRYTGQTVVEYLHRYRIGKAAEFLSRGLSVSETAFLSGFENLSFFTKIFKRYMGKTPLHYKKQ